MKLITRLSLLILLLFAASCREKKFTVEFDLGSDIETSYRLLYYAADSRGGVWKESAAPVHLGKFSIECPAIKPTIVYVSRSNASLPETFFYAERGNEIKITGKSPIPYRWKISGNKLTDRLSDWQSANLNSLEKNSPEAVNKAVASFVEKNPGSEIDPLLLLLRYDRGADPDGFVELWNSMNEKVRKEAPLELIPTPDLLSLSPLSFDKKGRVTLAPGKEKFTRLTMRSAGKGRDTLLLTAKGRKASLLWFWHLGDPERHVAADSLRALMRSHRNDSTRLLVADICLDSDSLRWKNALPFDSLSGVRRGWWPDGPATPDAMRLGVSAYRTFIVFGPKGEVLYKGDDLPKALSLLKSKI